ncbi:hypothetical protein CK475_20720 [Enterobacter cloacae]|nr:hypothetical protein CK475_20720 [Enterobacter cloacae]
MRSRVRVCFQKKTLIIRLFTVEKCYLAVLVDGLAIFLCTKSHLHDGVYAIKEAISKIGISDAYFAFPFNQTIAAAKCIINQCIEQLNPSRQHPLTESMLNKTRQKGRLSLMPLLSEG